MFALSRLTAAFLLVISIGIVDADAADARLQHVTLLAARDRVSLVFELTGEPGDVATRRVSAAILELDAGPVIAPARPTSFMAPPGTRFVMGVSIQGASGTGGRLKARITLLERARSAVRVLGRRVYVDFSAETQPVAPDRRAVSAPVPKTASVASAVPAPAAAPVASAHQTYRVAVQPAIERFEQLAPFLQSAVASPSEAVLKAVGSTLVGIQGVLLSVEVPAESKAVHDMLSSAVAIALTAVSPTFTGDRAAQAKQAQSVLQQVKSSL